MGRVKHWANAGAGAILGIGVASGGGGLLGQLWPNTFYASVAGAATAGVVYVGLCLRDYFPRETGGENYGSR